MPIIDLSERKILATGLLVLACSLAALTAALSVAALDHMAGAAILCSSPSAHCSACFGGLAACAAALVTGCAGLSLLRPPARALPSH